MIKFIDIWEITFNKVFLSCCKSLVIYDNYFYALSFFSLIAVFYLVELDSRLNPKGFIPGWRLAIRLGC